MSQQAMAKPTGEPWQGPFLVTKVLGPMSYEVQCLLGQRGHKHLHFNNLRLWVVWPGGGNLQEAGAECLLQEPEELWEGDLPWQGQEARGGHDQPVLDGALSEDQQGDLLTLLQEQPHVFSQLPGHTHLIEHTITTPPGKVARVRWRPILFKTKAAVEQEVAEMLRLEVIKPSTSEWQSPIVLVPKPDGSIRFCVDYWEVNGLAQFDAYPMPQADILIGQLGRAQYLSALDLMKGYWQVPVRPQDRVKTASATPTGLYQFKRMPFGLHRAAATFQRLVDRALEGCKGFARAYIDNIVVSSSSWPEHLDHLQQVLHGAGQGGPKGKPKKESPGLPGTEVLRLCGRQGEAATSAR